MPRTLLPIHWRLINGDAVEALPAALARARGSADARALAGADWLLRRKRDGRFLALRRGDEVIELRRGLLDADLRDEIARLPAADAAGETARATRGLVERLHALGLDEAAYAQRTGLALVAEPCTLAFAGRDRYGRPLWLRHARADDVALEAISGYRSHDYQLGIFRRKLARGLSVDEILRVNAAPGFSEHHGGLAIDVSTPGEPAAEESFERTPAFAWLHDRADDFDFVMSYPRDNPHGITYEPWHWRHAGA